MYNWGPAGHPIRIGSAPPGTSIPSAGSVQFDTLHWDGDQLIFQTNSSGQVDDIKVGTSGDITPLDPGFTGLTFWDRGPADPVTGSTVRFCHNINGTGTVGVTNDTGCQGSAMTGPTSFLWTSSAFGMPKVIPQYKIGIGQGALLGMARGDGVTDGLNTLQGVRTMDASAGTWTTPDAYAGTVRDPGSQKSYMWNNNNPIAYSDPSGYDPTMLIARPTPIPGTFHIFIEITHPDGKKERISFGPTYDGIRAIIGASTLDRKNQKYDRPYSGGAGGAHTASLGDCDHTCQHAMHVQADAVNDQRNPYGGGYDNSNSAGSSVCGGGFGSAACDKAHAALGVSTPGWDDRLPANTPVAATDPLPQAPETQVIGSLGVDESDASEGGSVSGNYGGAPGGHPN